MTNDYDPFAKNFSQTRHYGWPEFEHLFPYLKRGQRVLDLGCGNGRLRQFISNKIISEGGYYGLDLSNELLKIARNKYPHDHFFHGNFSEKLPFGAENFEIITAIASFHHILNASEQNRFLQEAHRVLKKNGIIFITTWKLPNKWFWPNILRGNWKNWLIPFGVEKFPRIYRRISPSEMKKKMKKNGFKVIVCDYFDGKNLITIAKKLK